ncbi:MAG: hypothetical protein ABSD57_13325 [Verrucomicrobiota bacterium]|jgi:phage shock protein PspC (stress-responsive transcriptional regulator)
MNVCRSQNNRMIAGVVIYLALWFLMSKAPPVPPPFESPVMQPWKKTL